MVYRLFLTGKEQSGKTALLIRALSDLRVISSGYALVRLKSEGGDRIGLMSPQEAAADELPLDAFPESVYSVETFLKNYPGILDRIPENGFVWMDPVLGAELSSPELAAREEALLTGETPVMGVISSPRFAGDAQTYERLISLLSEDEGTLLIRTDEIEEDEAISAMREWAEAVLDAAHHKKFDPLMKLGAKRRRPEFPPDYKG